MSDIPFLWADTLQEARDAHPDQPVVIICFRNTPRDFYLRYQGKFHEIDDGPYAVAGSLAWRWSIAGIWFNSERIDWMLNNSIEFPFSREDLVLYTLTWGDVCE